MPGTLTVETPNDHEIVIIRSFQAPRAVVWASMSRPDLIRRWVSGPPGWAMTTCEDDARVGGSFRWEWSGPKGERLTLSGVYLEIVPPERCVRTEVFATHDLPKMGEQQATLVLTEADGRTDLTITLRYDSREARDGALASGMERGMATNYDRLDAILAETAAQ